MPDRPLNATECEHCLDQLLDPVLTVLRTASTPAREIATLTRTQQHLTMHWLGVIAKTHPEMAYRFAQQATAR